jgi:ADP-heptose:LPS heptosyltransferase
VQYWGYNPRKFCSFMRLFLLPKPDWALVPGDNRYGWLAFVRGAKWISGFAGDRPAYKQWCFDELVALPSQPMAVTEMMQQLCTGNPAPNYQANQWKIHNTQPYQPVVQGAYILFHVGAKSATKHWDTKNWRALAQYFKQQNKQVVLSAGQGEEALLDAIIQKMSLPSYRANLNLLQLIDVMQKAELIICLDNGIGQLAKVIATPTICLFGAGSTVLFAEAPFWNKIPYRSITTVIKCRNTHSLFKRQITWVQTCNRSMAACQYKKALCMENITVTQVINSIE